jgi:hypothetical protein
MSNFEIFSGIYERLAQYSSSLAEGEKTRYAAFLAALESIKKLRDFFEVDPSDFSPPYQMLKSATSKFILTFCIDALDTDIQKNVKPEIERVKQSQTRKLRDVLEEAVLKYFSDGSNCVQEASLNLYLQGLESKGYPRQLLYISLLNLKKKYFIQNKPFNSSAAIYERVIERYQRTYFPTGHYDLILDPTVTTLYLKYKLDHDRVRDKRPYSARTVLELEKEYGDEEDQQESSHSQSLPNIASLKL